MERGDQLIILRTSHDDQSMPKLIAALTTLGIPLDQSFATCEMVDGEEQRLATWVLKTTSTCGRFQTHEMIRAWEDDSFTTRDPEHPMAYIKKAFENEAKLSHHLDGRVPQAIIRKGRKMAMLPFDLPDERREKLLAELES